VSYKSSGYYQQRRPYQTIGKDVVCPLIYVRVMGFETPTARVMGNRSLSVVVPEAKVSEVHEIIAAALRGLVLDNERPRLSVSGASVRVKL